jgi:hypothetical protein
MELRSEVISYSHFSEEKARHNEGNDESAGEN